MSKPLLQRLDSCPPFVCYYAAQRNRERRPTLDELVKLSGMSQRTFGRIAHKTTWAGVPIDKASRFLEACGVDVIDPESVMVWFAERMASGMLFNDFQNCRGQGQKMIAMLNVLAAKSVMAAESSLTTVG